MTTITRAALNDAATNRTGLAKADVANVADSMLRMMAEALMEGQNVKLTAFGSLQVRSRAERMGRNPRTGTEHRITSRHTVVFTPSAQLRDSLGKLGPSSGKIEKRAHEKTAVEG